MRTFLQRVRGLWGSGPKEIWGIDHRPEALPRLLQLVEKRRGLRSLGLELGPSDLREARRVFFFSEVVDFAQRRGVRVIPLERDETRLTRGHIVQAELGYSVEQGTLSPEPLNTYIERCQDDIEVAERAEDNLFLPPELHRSPAEMEALHRHLSFYTAVRTLLRDLDGSVERYATLWEREVLQAFAADARAVITRTQPDLVIVGTGHLRDLAIDGYQRRRLYPTDLGIPPTPEEQPFAAILPTLADAWTPYIEWHGTRIIAAAWMTLRGRITAHHPALLSREWPPILNQAIAQEPELVPLTLRAVYGDHLEISHTVSIAEYPRIFALPKSAAWQRIDAVLGRIAG